MKVYYAHHLWKYNTPIEDYETSLLERFLPQHEILNPRLEVKQAGEEESIMKDCLSLVSECEAIAFSDLSGVIGRGVYDEIQRAMRDRKPIYRIAENEVTLVKSIKYHIIGESARVYAIIKTEV